MAKLDDKRAARVLSALKANELRLRNWSGPDKWLFAIYDQGDSYLGCVVLRTDDTLVIDDPTKVARRERMRLESLCRTFNTSQAPAGRCDHGDQ